MNPKFQDYDLWFKVRSTSTSHKLVPSLWFSVDCWFGSSSSYGTSETGKIASLWFVIPLCIHKTDLTNCKLATSAQFVSLVGFAKACEVRFRVDKLTLKNCRPQVSLQFPVNMKQTTQTALHKLIDNFRIQKLSWPYKPLVVCLQVLKNLWNCADGQFMACGFRTGTLQALNERLILIGSWVKVVSEAHSEYCRPWFKYTRFCHPVVQNGTESHSTLLCLFNSKVNCVTNKKIHHRVFF